MDEFWKDITLSPSHPPISTAATSAVSAVPAGVSHTMILQEFLALPVDGRAQATVSTEQDGPPAATTLSLNTHVQFLSPPDVNSPPPLPPPLPTRRRVPETDGAGDRRHERLMKNRESAARSRARKQAYTYELEKKVALLKQENAQLRRQKEKLSGEAPAMISKKSKLYRTLTAPF